MQLCHLNEFPGAAGAFHSTHVFVSCPFEPPGVREGIRRCGMVFLFQEIVAVVFVSRPEPSAYIAMEPTGLFK